MTLMEYASIVRKRWIMIVSILILGSAAAVVGGSALSKPTYLATSKLLVNKTAAEEGGQAVNQADLQLNIMMINTYKELITTPPILQEVVRSHPELGLKAGELADALQVVSKAGSQIMSLSVKDRSYERASGIVNAVASVFQQKTTKLMGTQNVTILSEAGPADRPAPNQVGTVLLLLIGLVCSAILALLLAFLLEALDGSLKAPADVEKTLGYPVLVSIPEMKKGGLKTVPHTAEAAAFKRVGDDQRVHVNG
ncbi:YveK family protein [Cohnella nanjingensis]|uniref:Polysaccharide chain length determinant N-terminal domain-containing protein n=1 Tax=Cohnella nanjingensis TaxID=1387779 RepID=A0A7X0VF63_9BACL|nr:Wzz/FepE/Etk N-terminal domain-containing protein [Cohnella nanjingensis]MBB6671725.1 hypothetical protein [Cohnella nanjingensis]